MLSYDAEKAVTEGKFVGSEVDLQRLFLLGCTGNNISSVKLETGGRGGYGKIVAAYYEGKWNYFDDDELNFHRTWNTRYAAIGYRNGY